MITDKPVAHISEDGRVHRLQDHLRGTADLAARFAADFGCGEWGGLAGLWHDLGKYSDDFQRYIRAVTDTDAALEGKHVRVNHSTAGGIHAVEKFDKMGRVFAYLIAGHHAGLPDWQSETAGMAALSQRLRQGQLLQDALVGNIPADILNRPLPSERMKSSGTKLSRSLWLRMLFSCVVDADFLDTEAFLAPEKGRSRGDYVPMTDLLLAFVAYMAKKREASPATSVNRIRYSVLTRCVASAMEPPGIYTLTVPTGGGKTLSSMGFALNHAVKHGKHRIIYVIPYTSIIEQTADQFRAIFGEAVIEHHSNLDSTDETKENARSRLACENWDAPVIVTTTVQFFESLFASRTSRCRKLHNLVNSVVILDEAQLLPPDFLSPILEALKELQKNYRVTVVFCTATQPALGPHKTLDFDFKGIDGMKEIMDNPAMLHKSLKRTEIRQVRNLEPLTWEDVAGEITNNESVLCIVNRRDDARTLWELLPEGTIHLSALMCGAHRAGKIKEIKERLRNGVPTRVVSTQLVEAGVDVDFPVVYRAMAGLDSIAQAAGRCNREGLRANGDVFVFTPPSKVPVGHLRQAAEIGRRLLESAVEEPLAPERFELFFREFYWIRGPRLDAKEVLIDLANHPHLEVKFRTAARNFQLIDEAAQAPVIVRYENSSLIEQLERQKPERWLLRELQRSVVKLPRRLHARLVGEGAIREIHPGIFLQGHGALYHAELGFCPDKSIVYEPDELMS